VISSLTPPKGIPGFTFDLVVVEEPIDLAELFRAWEEAAKCGCGA
jgi:hypothetical protein